jgi:hypothetical protein
MSTKTELQTYELFTYDLWSDGEGGLTVNDVYRQGEIAIKVKGHVFNAGTPHEFISFEPSDYQLNRTVKGRGLAWDGESEHALYATDKNGNPACELRRVL